MPDTNMWCAHTKNPSSAIDMLEMAIHLYPNNGSTPEELLDNADKAMYQSKNNAKHS